MRILARNERIDLAAHSDARKLSFSFSFPRSVEECLYFLGLNQEDHVFDLMKCFICYQNPSNAIFDMTFGAKNVVTRVDLNRAGQNGIWKQI